MTKEKTRILPTEVIGNSMPAASIRGQLAKNVSSKIEQNFAESQFETKEEYIAHLIKNKKIRKQKSVSNEYISLSGCLVIDNTVKKGLDWSDVIADSAIVIDGHISKYQYLPRTRYGVKTNLTTENLDEYMKHNACEADKDEDGYTVKGIFRIPNIKSFPDFGNVSADKVLCYYDGKLELNNLPSGRNGFFGLAADNIITTDSDCAKTAKAKGFGKDICKALKSRTPGVFQKILGAFRSKNGDNRAQ